MNVVQRIGKFVFSRPFIIGLAISTTYEIIYFASKHYFGNARRSDTDELDTEAETTVIFFPDNQLACEAYFTYGCTNSKCIHSHLPTSTMQLLNVLKKATVSIELCVYCITATKLIDTVLAAHERGVIVRIISDHNQSKEQGGEQVAKLRSAGIHVEMNSNSFYMHHKFAVIDSSTVLTGSLNWSVNALLGNEENVVIIKNSKIARDFQEQFERLWEKFNTVPDRLR